MGEQRDANHTTPVDGIHNSVANISTSNRFDVLTHAPIDGNENVHTAERGNNKSPTKQKGTLSAYYCAATRCEANTKSVETE